MEFTVLVYNVKQAVEVKTSLLLRKVSGEIRNPTTGWFIE
jgi:hypothetical protein